jgi:hypothetical protein
VAIEVAFRLPRLFAKEDHHRALELHRRADAGARLVGHDAARRPPGVTVQSVDGDNLTDLRPGAISGVVTTDDYKAPLLALWHRGLGRIASLTAQADRQYSQRLNAWSGFAAFGAGLTRWLLSGDPPVAAQASLDRQGGQAIVRVDLDPDRTRGKADEVRTATATIVSPDPTDPSQHLSLTWVGSDTLEARFPVSPR